MVLVILAGGQGKRLLGATYPKVLLEFGGQCLAEMAVDAFAEVGVTKAVVVTGWRADLIRERLGEVRGNVRIRYADNERYEDTGAGFGLWLARALWAGRPCVIMEGDQLLHPGLVSRLMNGPDDCILVDAEAKPQLGEETVVVGKNGRVERLVWPAVNVRENEGIIGEAIVMVKLSAASSRRLAGLLDEGEIVEPLNRLGGLRYLGTGGLPWIEIDTPEDLEKAKEIHRRIEEGT